MIRTKEQLMQALASGKRLHGNMNSRPSAPWSYHLSTAGDEVSRETVHGNAFWAADKAGLLVKVAGNWNFAMYRAK
jgi:hypothetical protein